MKRTILTLLIPIFCIIIAFGQHKKRNFSLPDGIKKTDYSNQYVIVKIKTSASSGSRSGISMNEIFSSVEARSSRQLFPPHSTKATKRVSGTDRLSGIYKIQVAPGQDIEKTINRLLDFEEVEYAEPQYQRELLYIPNDPQADPETGAQRNHLEIIKAYDAWDIEQGDPNITVAIIDTGISPEHEDIIGQIVVNEGDPINGIDDDNDGYLDNYTGWDMADGDNDPTADGHPHGTWVGGASSSNTDNGVGVAGTGFKSSLLPLKIFTTNGTFYSNGFEAIVYAADHGCDVINLSWGAAYSYSQYEQDIINYAALDKDVVIVAAGGNSNKHQDFYPASYDNVLSVGHTTIFDQKSGGTTFSYKLDLTAPGAKVYTPDSGGGYIIKSGSSLAAPLVAGAAALVKAQHPNWTALQIAERLRVSADNIYEVDNNMDYFEKLGKGRLNMYSALSDNPLPSIRGLSYTIDSWKDEGHYSYSDTLSIGFELINYLSNWEDITVSLSTDSEYITITDSTINLAAINTLEKVHTSSTPFKFVVSEEVEEGAYFIFRLGFESEGYSDYQYFYIENPLFRALSINHSEYLDNQDTLVFDVDIKNFLYLEKGLEVTASSDSPYLIMTDSTFTIDSLYISQTISNSTKPFKAKLNGLPYDTPINLRLDFRDLNGYEDFQQFTIEDILGIETTSPLRVHPNPGNGIFNIMANRTSGGEIKVFNSYGEVIDRRVVIAGRKNTLLDLSTHPQGVYILHYTSGGKDYKSKLVINK